MPQLELVALIVREYQPAIDFFVNVLHFELVEDVPSLTNDGRPKRWEPASGNHGYLLRLIVRNMMGDSAIVAAEQMCAMTYGVIST
ncbi:MAG TPA: hypothetical protein VK516_06715, partial [Gemmatimonadaceae bacterium]|nr:hypothetical protein [Gemmatimonadaceae bacterium]